MHGSLNRPPRPLDSATAQRLQALTRLLRPTIDLLLASSHQLKSSCGKLATDPRSTLGRQGLVDAIRGILRGTARTLDISDRIEAAKITRLCDIISGYLGKIQGFEAVGGWTQAEVDRLSEILRTASGDASSLAGLVRARIPELAPWPELQGRVSEGFGNLERYWPLLGNAVRCEVEAEIAEKGASQAKSVKHIWAKVVGNVIAELAKDVSEDPEKGEGGFGFGVEEELKAELAKVGIAETGPAKPEKEKENKVPQPELASKALTKLMGAAKHNDVNGVAAAANELVAIGEATASLADAAPGLETNPSADGLRKLALGLRDMLASDPSAIRPLLSRAFALVGQIATVHDQVASFTIGSCRTALYAIEEESEAAFEKPGKVDEGKLGGNLDAVKKAVDRAAGCGLVGQQDHDAVVGRVEDLKHLVPIVNAAAQLAATVSEVSGGSAGEQWDGVKGEWTSRVRRLRSTMDGSRGIGYAAEGDERIMIGAAKHAIVELTKRLADPEVRFSPAAAKHVLRSLLETVAEHSSLARIEARRNGDQTEYAQKVLDDCGKLETGRLEVEIF